MTTQHTPYEQSDVDATVVEHLFTPETAVSSTATEILSPTEGELPVILPSPAQPTDSQDARQDEASVAQGENIMEAGTTEVNRTKGNLSETDMVETSPTEASMTETDTAETNPTAVDMEQTDTAEASLAAMGVDMAGADTTGTSSATTAQVPPHENTETIENEAIHSEPVVESSSTEPTPTFGEEHTAFSFMEEVPLGAVPGEVRSFIDYIEEFRQTEAWQNASLQESQGAFSLLTALTSDADTIYQAPTQSDTPVVPSVEIGEIPPAEVPAAEKIETTAAPASSVEEQATVDSTPVEAVDETTGVETPTLPIFAQPVAPPSPRPPAERPVSPLLRPATRLRLPRHGNVRQREEDLAGGTSPTPQATPEVPPVPQVTSAPAEAAAEPEQTRPARRYRFDRPATSSTPTASSGVTSPLSASAAPTSSAQQQRAEESREKDLLNRSNSTTPGRPENGQSGSGLVTETQPKQTANGNSSTLEHPATKLQEPVTPELTEMERRRRYGQDRQQEQPPSAPPTSPTGQTVPASPVPLTGMSATSQPEVTAATPVPQAEEIAPEDLPPLEYSELQKASSRRRRRHRAGPNNGSPAAAKSATPEAPAPAASQVMTPAGGTPPTPAMPTTPPRAPNNTVATPQQYNIVSGYTLNQMNQGNDHTGPFMAPEPSPARGSVSTRDGRNVRAEAQRTPVYPVRSPDVAPSVTSIQHLGSLLSQAIQTQTDRMVAELRRANQTPANISVSLPAFPSTERVGVFVDVANLLYSARTLRISIDFGKLLDFLRGNRRLVRAHAYCPTSPQPGDEQMFLQAVKGLGYRITTKNYKTFASGAKKADLDLDLCMDVVRLVEGRAVDCVVLVSGDSDFMPMLDYCSDHGVRVEVAAFDEAMSATLRQSCDLFINLSLLEEIRS